MISCDAGDERPDESEQSSDAASSLVVAVGVAGNLMGLPLLDPVAALVVGLLVLTGLFARIAALIGSGQMAFAYFTEHQPKGFWPIQNGGELAVLYCFAFLLIAFAGAGAFALQKHRS